jgi:hypothetical protein
MRYRFTVVTTLLLAAASSAPAITIGTHDSLDITFAGAAGGQFHAPSGSKGFADAVLYASLWHAFTENISARVTIKGAESANTPFVQEGYARWQRHGFDADAGFLANRFGQCRYYGSRVFTSALFDKFLLWDTYGAGFRLSQHLGPVGMAGGVTLDNRESVAAHLMPSIESEHWWGRALAAFETCSFQNQDNDLVFGGEAAMEYPALSVHALARYERYLGYGHTTNVTMKPGHQFDGYLELLLTPIPEFELTGLVRYQLYEKRYSHETTFGGAEALWLPVDWLAVGAGVELVYELALLTSAPALIVELRPIPHHAQVRVYGNRRQTGDSSPTYTVGGAVWLDF